MKCNQCGTENNASAKFCKQCGTSLAPAAAATTTCHACNAELQPGARFCPRCGASTDSVANRSAAAHPPEEPQAVSTVVTEPVPFVAPALVPEAVGDAAPISPVPELASPAIVVDLQPEPVAAPVAAEPPALLQIDPLPVVSEPSQESLIPAATAPEGAKTEPVEASSPAIEVVAPAPLSLDVDLPAVPAAQEAHSASVATSPEEVQAVAHEAAQVAAQAAVEVAAQVEQFAATQVAATPSPAAEASAPVTASMSAVPSSPVVEPRLGAATAPFVPPTQRKSNWLALGALGAAVVCALGIGAFWVTTKSSSNASGHAAASEASATQVEILNPGQKDPLLKAPTVTKTASAASAPAHPVVATTGKASVASKPARAANGGAAATPPRGRMQQFEEPDEGWREEPARPAARGWHQELRQALAQCEQRNSFARPICMDRARWHYCPDHWDTVAECKSTDYDQRD